MTTVSNREAADYVRNLLHKWGYPAVAVTNTTRNIPGQYRSCEPGTVQVQAVASLDKTVPDFMAGSETFEFDVWREPNGVIYGEC